ncbi:NAD-P-binding protein [Pilatotrama ljubarskyi]|nr:NAD-P-binding protein [Pilatotrama ljubarskyi]
MVVNLLRLRGAVENEEASGHFVAITKKASNALRFGILGAARIGPDALLTPAKSHAEVVISAVACRDPAKGTKYAKTHSIPKVYSRSGCYQKLLDDAEIDAVYVALPNALHFEWSMRGLNAGKHVLIEKPVADTAEEARQIFALAEVKGLVALEAIHFTFHPATQRVKAIIDSGELGKVKNAVGEFAVPSILSPFFFLKDDIRFSYDLGGSCTMDMGVYPLAAIRYLTGTEMDVPQVTKATAFGQPETTRIDRGMHTTYALPDSVSGEMYVDFAMPGWGPFGMLPRMPKLSVKVALEGGDIEFFNYPLAGSYHWIKVKPRRGSARTEKVYKLPNGGGETSWTTYRYQLEAFVDKVRGRTPQYWTNPKTTIMQMECIEKIYSAAGMPPRIASSYVPPVM